MIKGWLRAACAQMSGDSLRARLIRGGLGSAGIQAVNGILTLVLGIVLARMLGPKDYGVYAYAFAIMNLLMVAAEVGVPTLLMREVASSLGLAQWGLLRGALRRCAQFVALAATSISLLGFVILTWFADSIRPVVMCTMALMLLMLPVSALRKTVVHAIRGLDRVVAGLALEMFIQPLLVLIIVSLVFIAWPEQRKPHVAMAAQILSALVVLLIGTLVLRRLLPHEIRTAVPEYQSRKWRTNALAFTLIGGAGIINNQADMIMIGWLMTPEDVASYRVAMQGATLVAFGLQVANSVLAPQFSRLYAQGDIEGLQRLATSSARVILAAALPLASAFVLAGRAIVGWVFGAEYAAAHVPLGILAVGQLINAGFGSVGCLLNMTGHERVTARILWQTALLNIVMNVFLIPPFGTAGAAAASATSLALWNVLLYRKVRKQLGINSTAMRV